LISIGLHQGFLALPRIDTALICKPISGESISSVSTCLALDSSSRSLLLRTFNSLRFANTSFLVLEVLIEVKSVKSVYPEGLDLDKDIDKIGTIRIFMNDNFNFDLGFGVCASEVANMPTSKMQIEDKGKLIIESKNRLERRLKKGDCFFIGDGEISFGKDKAERDLKNIVQVLSSNKKPKEKHKILSQLGLLPPGRFC